MRGDADPAAGLGPELKPGRLLAAALVLLAAALATGGAASIFLPLLAASLVLCIRYIRAPAVLAAPAVVAVVLLAHSVMGDDVAFRSLVGPILLAAATLPGWLWRREARRASSAGERLADIEAQVNRARKAEAPAAADDLEDLERALAAVAERLNAKQATLWDVDGYHNRARSRVASTGRGGLTLRLSGDPLGWAWEQGMRLRLEPAPRWAEHGTAVVADRLRRHEDDGILVTYVFDPASIPVEDGPFEEAAVYLRGILNLQEATAHWAGGQRRLAALLSGLGHIPGELDLEPFAAGLCATAMATAEGTGAILGLWQEEHGLVLAVAGEDGGPRPNDTFLATSSELGLAVRAGQMIVRDAGSWSLGRTAVAHDDERWVTRPRALATLPLRGPAGIIGVLAVWTSRHRELDPEALELLHLLSPYAAVHLEHAKAFGRLRESADTDPLTGLNNRRAFDAVFAAETQRFERYTRPMSLLVLDLDHFKGVNDQHGHEAGDEVLRRVSAVVAASIRDVDTAARFGGEEFIVLMPETPLHAAVEVAERIRTSVAGLQVLWRGEPIPVRVSVGVSSAPERVKHPHELLGSADAALYRAKEAGRDRVIAA